MQPELVSMRINGAESYDNEYAVSCVRGLQEASVGAEDTELDGHGKHSTHPRLRRWT